MEKIVIGKRKSGSGYDFVVVNCNVDDATAKIEYTPCNALENIIGVWLKDCKFNFEFCSPTSDEVARTVVSQFNDKVVDIQEAEVMEVEESPIGVIDVIVSLNGNYFGPVISFSRREDWEEETSFEDEYE